MVILRECFGEYGYCSSQRFNDELEALQTWYDERSVGLEMGWWNDKTSTDKQNLKIWLEATFNPLNRFEIFAAIFKE